MNRKIKSITFAITPSFVAGVIFGCTFAMFVFQDILLRQILQVQNAAPTMLYSAVDSDGLPIFFNRKGKPLTACTTEEGCERFLSSADGVASPPPTQAFNEVIPSNLVSSFEIEIYSIPSNKAFSSRQSEGLQWSFSADFIPSAHASTSEPNGQCSMIKKRVRRTVKYVYDMDDPDCPPSN